MHLIFIKFVLKLAQFCVIFLSVEWSLWGGRQMTA